MGENFVPALLVLGGMGLALHYEQLVALYDGAPPILACGPSVSGKSLAVQIAMSLIGEETSIGGYCHWEFFFLFFSFHISINKEMVDNTPPRVESNFGVSKNYS